jgi:hypothetical protein
LLLAWPHVARKKKLLLPPPLPLLLPPLSKSLLTPLQRLLLMPSLLTLLRLLLLPLPHLLLPQPSNSALFNKKGKGDLAFFVAQSSGDPIRTAPPSRVLRAETRTENAPAADRAP